MTETLVYRDQTMKGLFDLYVEARETGAKELSEDIWERLLTTNRRKTIDKLYKLRNELNGLIDKGVAKKPNEWNDTNGIT